MPSRAIHLLSLFVCKVVSLHTYRPLGVTPYLHVCAYTRQQAQQRDRVKALQACNICMVLAICNVHVDHMDLHPDALALSKEPRQIHKNYVLFFFFLSTLLSNCRDIGFLPILATVEVAYDTEWYTDRQCRLITTVPYMYVCTCICMHTCRYLQVIICIYLHRACAEKSIYS